MKHALYYAYGHYLSTAEALKKMKSHGLTDVLAWIGQCPAQNTAVGEHELYTELADNGMSVSAAYLPAAQLPYLSNTRYGKKDAIKAYKQYILSASELRVPLLIMDAAKTCEPLIEALQELANYAAEKGVLLCIRDGADTDVVGLLSRVDNLYYCLDTAMCIKYDVDAVQRIRDLRQRLMFVVLSDLNADDSRILPGSGKHDFAPVYKALKADNYTGVCGVHATSCKGAATADAFLDAVLALANNA